jgi:hypothetical protein
LKLVGARAVKPLCREESVQIASFPPRPSPPLFNENFKRGGARPPPRCCCCCVYVFTVAYLRAPCEFAILGGHRFYLRKTFITAGEDMGGPAMKPIPFEMCLSAFCKTIENLMRQKCINFMMYTTNQQKNYFKLCTAFISSPLSKYSTVCQERK